MYEDNSAKVNEDEVSEDNLTNDNYIELINGFIVENMDAFSGDTYCMDDDIPSNGFIVSIADELKDSNIRFVGGLSIGEFPEHDSSVHYMQQVKGFIVEPLHALSEDDEIRDKNDKTISDDKDQTDEESRLSSNLDLFNDDNVLSSTRFEVPQPQTVILHIQKVELMVSTFCNTMLQTLRSFKADYLLKERNVSPILVLEANLTAGTIVIYSSVPID